MANVFDQAAPSDPLPAGFYPDADRVWGYAGFWWRVLAWLIDGIILSVIDWPLQLLVGDGSINWNSTHTNSGAPVSNISTIAMVTSNLGSSVTSSWHTQTPHLPGLATLIAIVIQLAYFTLMESSRWQATVGKRVCQLRVTGLDGSRISQGRALGRNLGKYLSALILCIGFLMVAWTRRKQGLHDLLAETLVVRKRPPNDLVRFNPPG